METAAAALLEAGVGRFSRAPAMAAALLAEMWAPLAVALAALATLPSLLRRLQVIVLRLRSRGKEVIQSHIGTYYSSCDEDGSDDGGDEDESSDDEASSSGDDDEAGEDLKRIGFYDGAAVGGVLPWGGAVVRTWQGLPRRFPGCSSGLGGGAGSSAIGGAFVPAAVRLWGASTASGDPWWAAAGAREEACDGRRRPRVGWGATGVYWNIEKEETQKCDSVDISIAVATEKGLMTPIIRNADQKTISAISSEVKQLAEKARAGKLAPNEFQGGSFSISNLGMYPVDHFCAIINPPQSGILAVGRGNKVVEPVVDSDGIFS